LNLNKKNKMKTYHLNMTLSADTNVPENEILDKLVQFAEDNKYLLGGGLQAVEEDQKPEQTTYMKPEEDTGIPYCPVCTGCGEEGCCSPLNCEQNPDGKYCEWYLRDLKFGYKMYDDVYDLISKDDEAKKKLDEIFKKNFELFYGKK